MPLNVPKLLQELAKHRVERVRQYRERAKFDYDAELVALRDRVKALEEGAELDFDFAADDAAILTELAALRDQLAVVALYRIVELNTSRIMAWAYGSEAVKKRKLYVVTNLEVALRKDFSLELSSLRDYPVIDELRLVNNAVKHENAVTKEIAKRTGWMEGTPLLELESRLDRYMDAIPDYLLQLGQAVIPNSSGYRKGK